MKAKCAVITGASRGIGAAVAERARAVCKAYLDRA